MALAPDTPLYKFLVVVRGRDVVVFARDLEGADDIAAALSGEPQRTLPAAQARGRERSTRTMHHPILRGGLREYTYGERLREAHIRLGLVGG